MGNSQKKDSSTKVEVKEVVKEVVKYVESDESKRAAMLAKLDHQLDSLRKEVASIQPVIRENVHSTVFQLEDATLLRYSQLEDMTVIKKNIEQIFEGFPVMSVIVDAASNMIAAMKSTEELTEIMRWHQRKVMKRVGKNVYGMEVHYKVKILEETKGAWLTSKKKETVVLVAYKAIAHSMSVSPDKYPDDEVLGKLTF